MTSFLFLFFLLGYVLQLYCYAKTKLHLSHSSAGTQQKGALTGINDFEFEGCSDLREYSILTTETIFYFKYSTENDLATTSSYQ